MLPAGVSRLYRCLGHPEAVKGSYGAVAAKTCNGFYTLTTGHGDWRMMA
jgi:hypothetical protein